jgi:hypothetical protein
MSELNSTLRAYAVRLERARPHRRFALPEVGAQARLGLTYAHLNQAYAALTGSPERPKIRIIREIALAQWAGRRDVLGVYDPTDDLILLVRTVFPRITLSAGFHEIGAKEVARIGEARVMAELSEQPDFKGKGFKYISHQLEYIFQAMMTEFAEAHNPHNGELRDCTRRVIAASEPAVFSVVRDYVSNGYTFVFSERDLTAM